MQQGKGKDRESVSDLGQLSVPAVLGVKIPTEPCERIWPRSHYEHQAPGEIQADKYMWKGEGTEKEPDKLMNARIKMTPQTRHYSSEKSPLFPQLFYCWDLQAWPKHPGVFFVFVVTTVTPSLDLPPGADFPRVFISYEQGFAQIPLCLPSKGINKI